MEDSDWATLFERAGSERVFYSKADIVSAPPLPSLHGQSALSLRESGSSARDSAYLRWS